MKKYFLSALALPLLFACSSEDYLDQKATDNDQFAGIEKVDATFSLADMDEGPSMRMATQWGAEVDDRLGFAWLTNVYDGTSATTKLTITGEAYQNHPLFLKQEGKNYKFVPETSIYVGKYFVYYPFDETTVDVGKINFKSLVNQPLTDGKDKFKAIAVNSINIGDKFTVVTPDGDDLDGDGKMWNKPGIKESYKLYAAPFSNQTGLELTYLKNNPSFTTPQTITGATDINLTYAAGEPVGDADIYGATVQLAGASNSFTYGPTDADMEPIKVAGATEHKSDFWANKKDVAAAYGFTFEAAAPITLTPNNKDKKISTGAEGSEAWFWFNSLPVTNGDATSATTVTPVFKTSYGTVTINTGNTLKDVAYEYVNFGDAKNPDWQWVKLVAGTTDDESTSPKKWAIDAGAPAHNTFVNQYGDHKGKYTFTVDFSTGVMDGMHITDDTHLQKALKYYLASGKTETVRLLLDADAKGEFKLSKISIALIQTINAAVGANKVRITPCTTDGTPKIIITQDGQTGDLAAKKEVPNLNGVFQKVGTKVYLAANNSDGKAIDWTWKGGDDGKTALPVDGAIASITNEGTLTVNATNVELSVAASTLENAAGATMNITQVTTVKNALTNLGTINVGSKTNTSAELRAYAVAIDNDATGLKEGEYGVIKNYGVVGVTEGTSGKFNNYGFIDMTDDDAITLLTTNELTSDFDDAFNASTNKMGTVKLPNNNPLAIVSVANKDANGFIRYTWPADQTTYVTPTGNVKYNTIVVSGNIEFTEKETEIQYIAFTGVRTQVVNKGYLTSLKGIMVDNENHNASIIIEKGNMLNPKNGTFLGTGATVYYGGTFTHNAKVVGTTASNYFGTWSTDQIVKY